MEIVSTRSKIAFTFVNFFEEEKSTRHKKQLWINNLYPTTLSIEIDSQTRLRQFTAPPLTFQSSFALLLPDDYYYCLRSAVTCSFHLAPLFFFFSFRFHNFYPYETLITIFSTGRDTPITKCTSLRQAVSRSSYTSSRGSCQFRFRVIENHE